MVGDGVGSVGDGGNRPCTRHYKFFISNKKIKKEKSFSLFLKTLIRWGGGGGGDGALLYYKAAFPVNF